jgi:hypothetical protein
MRRDRLDKIRRAIFGSERDVYDPQLFRRITVGALGAFVAVGGDFLGSCVYGPDVIGRATRGRTLLLVSTAATLLTIAILATSFAHLVDRFPIPGGGYAVAQKVTNRILALISGGALLFDAIFNVAVSVVTCVDAAADALPAFRMLRLPTAFAIILALTIVNLRGLRESVGLLIPILLAFIGSHLFVLGFALFHAPPLSGALHAIPRELGRLRSERGTWNLAWLLFSTYALTGPIYTGLESISNAVPTLKEPKPRTARRAMILLAGVPGGIITALLMGYFLYDLHPTGGRTMNALLFEGVASHESTEARWPHLFVTFPLLTESALLIISAQTGFVDGPRIIAALAADSYLPRRLTRLNGRLAPAAGILAVAIAATVSIVLAGGTLRPLVAVFVVAVFVTFTVSQWAMLRASFRVKRSRTPWFAGFLLHLVAFAITLAILAGTVANWWREALITLGLVGLMVFLMLFVSRRYRATVAAVQETEKRLTNETTAGGAIPLLGLSGRAAGHRPIALVFIDPGIALEQRLLLWMAQSYIEVSEIVLVSVAAIDTEALEREAHLRERERQHREKVARIEDGARKMGVPVRVLLRRGADVLETAATMIREYWQLRPEPKIVVGFRTPKQGSAVDRLVADELALRLQDRLERAQIPMVVVSTPLE